MSDTVLIWIDLETTGLDKKDGRILEYAVIFTDLELNELGSITDIVPQNAKEARIMMDDYVTGMHTKNGLLEELDDFESNNQSRDLLYLDNIKQAELDILERLRLLKGDETIFTIAGNTVGTFDKGWIELHMPKLFEELHYRQLDVTTYKVGFPDIFGVETSIAHRALDDIKASVEQHRKMKEIVEKAWKYDQLEK